MDKYRTLAANTALISIGTFASKFLLFFMVRFYTAYLSPSDYGTADLITQTANLLIPVVSQTAYFALLWTAHPCAKMFLAQGFLCFLQEDVFSLCFRWFFILWGN